MIQLTLTEILEKFQNGEQRYDKDAYFKEAITAIHLGVGPYAVLDRVLKEHLILMNLHNEAVNKNRVAVGEVARLTDINEKIIVSHRSMEDKLFGEQSQEANTGVYVGREYYPNELETLRAQVKGLICDKQKLADEVASLTEALQHHIK